MTRFLFFALFVIYAPALKAQRVDSIYVHLYTDSLKKGTYNYINIDGRLSNGRYLPLDSTDIRFSASEGRFAGNSLIIDPRSTAERVTIRAVLRSNPALFKEFTVWIKKKEE